MPQLAPVVLKDAAAADHTFSPIDIREGVSYLGERLSTGMNEMYQSVLPRSDKGHNAIRRFSLPIVRTNADGQPVVVSQMTANVRYGFPPECTSAERDQLIAFVENCTKEAGWKLAVRDGVNYY